MSYTLTEPVVVTATLSTTDWTAVSGFDSGKWAKIEIINHSASNDLRFRFSSSTGDGVLITANSDKDHAYRMDIPREKLFPLDSTTPLYVKAVTANVEYSVVGIKGA